MPHTKSAGKRLRQNEKRRLRNRAVAKNIKKVRRAVADDLKAGDVAKAATDAVAVQATLDRAATKGYIHPNKAARLKSRLAKRLKAAANAPAKA